MKNDEHIGRKARNLMVLRKRFPKLVPEFMVLGLDEVFVNSASVLARLNTNANEYLSKQTTKQKYQKEFMRLINSLELNCDYLSKLSLVLKENDFTQVSYRTSAHLEDLNNVSYAGQYRTYLNKGCGLEELQKYCVLCLKSMFNISVLDYAHANRVGKFVQSGSIVVQKMFFGNYSGVLFSENGLNQVEISYVNSWKNQVVDGQLSSNLLIEKSRFNIAREIPGQLPKSMIQVIDAALQLELLEGNPVDVEWSVSSDQAALLQFRPVTTKNLEYSIEWDNTNIAESYPGVTLPLTYSFIRKLYANVYPEFLKLLGKRESDLSSKKHIFENMLGYVNGRVYYNINNWYKLVALLPGYRHNKDFFEAMLMPAKKKQNDSKGQVRARSLTSKAHNLITAARFIYLLLSTNRLSLAFSKRYKARFDAYRKIDWNQLTAQAIVDNYLQIESDLLQQWAVPILNDFRTMVFHGILRKFFFSQVNDEQYLDWLSGIYDQTSVEPVRELESLVKQVSKYLTNDASGLHYRDSKVVNAIINDPSQFKLKQRIKNYLEKYGGRSPDELKLENPRLAEDFKTFATFVVSSASGFDELEFSSQKIKKFNNRKQRKLRTLLPNKINPMFWLVLHQAKSGISTRERFRYYRAQVFGIARKAYLALGQRFVEAKLIYSIDDIFYLTTSEIHDLVLGHTINNSIIDQVSLRKKIFSKYFEKQSARRLISEGLVAPQSVRDDHALTNSSDKLIKGLGVSKGRIRGEVLVVRRFDPKVKVSGKILVTEHTDPGWTLLFLNAAGVIVERGNALSHASIVARELGIPAVVAVEGICDKLKNGDQVEMDGSRGEIIVT